MPLNPIEPHPGVDQSVVPLRPIELHPGVGQLIFALANKSGMNLTVALRELIDNALDAGAKVIVIRYNRRRRTFEIEDDGRGTADIDAIVTPFKHSKHTKADGPLSGRFGIGGTASQIYLTEGAGRADVTSVTAGFIYRLHADYAKMATRDAFVAMLSSEVNVGDPTGTKITLTECRELNQQHIGSANRELSFTFAPAMRNGVSITFDSGGEAVTWEAKSAPKLVARLKFDFMLGRHHIKGFVGLTKVGAPNFVKGWAVALNHRFIGRFTYPASDPAADKAIDLARIYSEVILPSDWDNINDHKDDFITPQTELWAKLAEVSAPILGRAEQEGHSIEFAGALRVAQSQIDQMFQGIKGRREKPADPEAGTNDPSGRGGEHKNFSKAQPGDKAGRVGGGSISRIMLVWTTGLTTRYEVRPEGRIARVDIDKDHPDNQIFKGESAGIFMAHYFTLAVIADAAVRPKRYTLMFPDILADEIPYELERLRVRMMAVAAAKENLDTTA